MKASLSTSARHHPGTPSNWVAPAAKSAQGEPDFHLVDNPGNWLDFTFRPQFKTPSGPYVCHALPTGATPVPETNGKDGGRWEFHYSGWMPPPDGPPMTRSFLNVIFFKVCPSFHLTSVQAQQLARHRVPQKGRTAPVCHADSCSDASFASAKVAVPSEKKGNVRTPGVSFSLSLAARRYYIEHSSHCESKMTMQRYLSTLLMITLPLSLVRAFVVAPRIPRRFALSSIAENAKKQTGALADLYGGDYAGLTATFSSTTGALLPVPEYLVPKVLLEWGQAPSCLEVIVSEEVDGDHLTRQTVTVVPDVGCGVDNLDTLKSQEKIDLTKGRLGVFDSSVVAFDYSPQDGRIRSETTFLLANTGQRLRVLVHVEEGRDLKSPITVVLERQTCETSSGGTIADGGGLDARTVSQLLGDGFRGKKFADIEPVAWDKGDEERMTTLILPGNATISYGALSSTGLTLEVGHVTDGASRRVVRRRFREDGTLEGPIEHWVETS